MSGNNRKKCVGGNWKMNGSTDLVKTLVAGALNAASIPENTEVIIAPPFPYLADVKKVAGAHLQVAAQNLYDKAPGAYTGEVSAAILKDLGIEWVILGHSERREYFHETDEVVGKKVAFALGQGLKVIACIGEKLEEREKGITNEVCFRQLAAIEKEIKGNWKDVVIAYEPVWAIGTGKVATPEQAQEVHHDIRKWLSDNVSADVAAATRIQYGGSVNEKNCKDLSKQPDIDGFLVGGASLKPEFAIICQAWA